MIVAQSLRHSKTYLAIIFYKHYYINVSYLKMSKMRLKLRAVLNHDTESGTERVHACKDV